MNTNTTILNKEQIGRLYNHFIFEDYESIVYAEYFEEFKNFRITYVDRSDNIETDYISGPMEPQVIDYILKGTE